MLPTYLTHGIQNEFIDIIGFVVLNMILERIKRTECYSILVDETMDTCGVKQLDAESISNILIKSLLNWGLDLNKLIGQGYDDASTMSGKISGVRKRIQDQYKKAIYVHCSSH